MADVKFEDNSMKVKAAIDEALLQFLEEAAATLQSQAEDNTPRDSSNLFKSWDHKVDESKMEATIGSPLENAIWTEFGTGEHALKNNGRQSAWYVPIEKVTGKKKPSFNGKVVIVYGKNGQKYYKTNGKKPVRMLFNAFSAKKNAIIRMAEELFKERLK